MEFFQTFSYQGPPCHSREDHYMSLSQFRNHSTVHHLQRGGRIILCNILSQYFVKKAKPKWTKNPFLSSNTNAINNMPFGIMYASYRMISIWRIPLTIKVFFHDAELKWTPLFSFKAVFKCSFVQLKKISNTKITL